jgi:hypothetical protein
VLEWISRKARRSGSSLPFDSEGIMDRTTNLQQLLRNLLPSRGRTAASHPEFMDTRPEPHLRQVPSSRRPTVFAESSVDLALGTDIMEYPEDTAADLMDEFFANAEKRAA